MLAQSGSHGTLCVTLLPALAATLQISTIGPFYAAAEIDQIADDAIEAALALLVKRE